MHVSSRLALVGAGAVLALVVTPVAASAHGGDHTLIKAAFTPSKTTDPAINGVNPGGRDWILDRGEVRVRDTGRTDVRLEGLQIPAFNPDGTAANPVALITVSLYCGGTLAARSDPQPLSRPDGDARFRITLAAMDSCDAATVLINPNNPAAYIASAMAGDEDDDDD